MSPSSAPEPAGGVAAVDRAFALIDALVSAEGPMALADLARATGYYKSTILRLLVSLERATIVVRRPDDRYELGPLAYRLGQTYDRALQVNEKILATLKSLVARGTESASFHTPYNDDYRLCLLRVDSSHPTLDRIRQGDLLPADRGAPAEVIARFAHYRGECPMPDASLVHASRGARDRACAAVSCPVFARGDRFIGALSLSGPKERFTEQAIAHMSALLLQSACSLSESLGGQWPGRRQP